MTRKRFLNLAAFLALLVIEILIALFVHDSFIRPYVGDVLAVAVVYFFLRIFIPEKYPWLPAAVLAFAVLAEGLQYFHLAERLGITNPLLRTVLGSVYDTKDIACYAVGCVFLAAYERARRRRNLRR